MNLNDAEILSALINYPTRSLVQDIDRCKETFIDKYDEAVTEIGKFEAILSELSVEDREEYYATTFDIQGMCCLDLGYVLFGEDYKRGEFLVNISAMQRDYKVDLGAELADHLPNVLKLIGVMEESKMKKDLIEKVSLPAIIKMLENFQIGKNSNAYMHVLRAIYKSLSTDYKMDDAIFGGPVC